MTRITSGAEQPDVDLSHTAAVGGADHLTGREVIARDVAVGRHGPTGKTIQFAGIDKVLLAPRPGTDDDLNGVEAGWSGLECLSGIPGSAGATPIQNVGAYGQEVAETVSSVEAYDRVKDEVVRLAAEDCGFAYRSSIFRHSDRWAVRSVDFRLTRSPLSTPVRYAELARRRDRRAPCGPARRGGRPGRDRRGRDALQRRLHDLEQRRRAAAERRQRVHRRDQ